MACKRRCYVFRGAIVLPLLLMIGLLALILTARLQQTPTVRVVGTSSWSARTVPTWTGTAEEPFDLGPDPFQDKLRDELLRNLSRAQARLAAARGLPGPVAAAVPVIGSARPAHHVEVRRKTARRRSRQANATDIAVTLAQLRRQLDEEERQLPAGWLERRLHQPRSLFLVTTWRSGSTYLGHVLSSHPGVFSHYEPLMSLGVRQARTEADLQLGHTTLRELLACRYHTLPAYMNATRRHTEDMLSHNPRVWSACLRGTNRNTCTNETFLAAACRLLPLRVFKLVRLRLREMERYLAGGDALVLYLVRDPRATVSSRLSSVRWCRGVSECVQPHRLCADLRDDLATLQRLRRRFPAAVRLVRYERLASQPERELRDIFRFAGLRWTRQIAAVVADTTQQEQSAPWSVHRKSAQHVDRWKRLLTDKQLRYINRTCEYVINKLQ